MGFVLVCFYLNPLVMANAQNEPIEVQIKGFDDGQKSNKQQDYKEALLFAKREAIERAGVEIQSMSKMQDFVLHSDVIESKSKAILLPGFQVLDIGYQNDGSYLVILTGRIDMSTALNSEPMSLQTRALNELAAGPQNYIFDLGADIGQFSILEAKFSDDNEFTIHYDYREGVITLANIGGDNMLLKGRYQTSVSSGDVSLEFKENGTAQGHWSILLLKGNIVIRRK